jgi:hypothetical protein
MRGLGGMVGLAVIAALLSGCGPTAAEQRAMDEQKCHSFGFQFGTDAFATCLMNITQHREAEAAADRRAWQAQQAEAARKAQEAAQQNSSSSSAGSSPSGFPSIDLSSMKCNSTTTTSGSTNNSTTTTNTSCHN